MRSAFGAADASVGRAAREALNPRGRASAGEEVPPMSERDRRWLKEVTDELDAADAADRERTARLRGERP